MAVVLEGVGKVKPDDMLEGKSDRQLNSILKGLRQKRKDNGKLTDTQQRIFDNATKMKNARKAFREKYNVKGANLTGATLAQLRAARSNVAAFLQKLKEGQKASRPPGRGRRNPSPPSGEPF